MLKTILAFLKRAAWAVRLAVAVCLLSPILLFMIWFNYTVDRAGLFQGDRFEREVSLMLLDGQDVSGYEQMDERQISQLIIQNFKKTPKTIAIGSSRILQMTVNEVKSDDFFNLGMVSATYKDVFNVCYLLEKAQKLPQNIVIGFDPWYLNPYALDNRSDSELYSRCMFEMQEPSTYEKTDTSAMWTQLFSPNYFQGCLEYYFRDTSLEKLPSTVEGDVFDQATEIKRSDGSVLYTKSMRDFEQETIAHLALIQSQSFPFMSDYDAPDAELTRLFDKLLSRMQANGCNIIFVLSPYQHTLWDIISTEKSRWYGFFETEQAVRELAERHNIPVYGSYNPYALEGITPFDFHDGLHVKSTGISKFFPGIYEIEKALEKNIYPEVPPYDTADTNNSDANKPKNAS